MSRTINIVSFDVPFPPNYGGVIDVYYKLRSLKESGVSVILHCFAYGRERSHFLDEVCSEVHYYKRRTGVAANFSLLPYTVVSRHSEALAAKLLSNDHPILFEVLHTCGLLGDPRFVKRLKVYRHSNIEHQYYRALAGSEKKFARRLYLWIEAMRLKRFEKVVSHANLILAVNRRDTAYFKEKYPAVRSVFLPSFHPFNKTEIYKGTGKYVLFHGNLGISENYESASWLLEHVFSHIIFNVVIAGLNPPAFLRRAIAKYRHIQLVENPSSEKMDALIAGAQLHCLHTHQPTGLKLKLLHVLFRGRFIVTNPDMLDGTGLRANSSLLVAGTPNEYVSEINRMFNQPFDERHDADRQSLIAPFSNSHNVQELIREVWGD